MLFNIFRSKKKERLLEDKSIRVTDQKLIDSFVSRPDFPYMVSFPRTGSHWLRMLMELYFEKPSLARIFYYYDAKDFTCYHRHDEDLTLQHQNIIYLYRDAVPTIFSQMTYYKEDVNDRQRIIQWSSNYAKHLEKWLITESFTERKTILRYERLRDDMVNEFQKICSHMNAAFSAEKINKAATQVTKAKLKEKSSHDKQVVVTDPVYERRRLDFVQNHSSLVMDTVVAVNPRLQLFFQESKIV